MCYGYFDDILNQLMDFGGGGGGYGGGAPGGSGTSPQAPEPIIPPVTDPNFWKDLAGSVGDPLSLAGSIADWTTYYYYQYNQNNAAAIAGGSVPPAPGVMSPGSLAL